MFKSLTSNQILLMVIAIVLLILAAFAFYLLQDPSAPFPFSAAPPTNTVAPLQPTSTGTPAPSATPEPTRQTSYTPFAQLLTSTTTSETTGTPATATIAPSATIPPLPPTITSTFVPGTTPTLTQTPAPGTITATPTASATLESGQHGFTGRIIQNGTPVANIVVEFTDDDPTRQDRTDSGGHYWFITLAPGTTFDLTFNRAHNLQLTPAPEIAGLAWLEGTLPLGVEVIAVPDLDISLNLDGVIFQLQTPVDGATYSAAAISSTNPIQLVWTEYEGAESYHVELGKNGSDEPVWSSNETTVTNLMWNGTLDDGTHISEGNYWWRVGVKKTSGNYKQFIFTQTWDLKFNP